MRVDGARVLNPGRLRDQIVIQSPTKSQNSFGEDVVTWGTYATVRALVQSIPGREVEAVQQTWADAKYKIVTQWIDDVEREFRVLWGTKVLDILDVRDEAGTRTVLTMYARELAE